MPSKMINHPIFTYQTRLALDADQDARLTAYAALYGQAERSLFAALRAGGSLNPLKRTFLKRFGVTARQFNALRVGLDGKIAAIQERRPQLIAEAEIRIRRAEKVIIKMIRRAAQPSSPEKSQKDRKALHEKKRRLATLKARYAALKDDHQAGVVRLCFGGKKLFRAQFALEENGYADHAAWQSDWHAARHSQFFVLGSQDETAGNQSCQAVLADDRTLTLHLRLPPALATQGTHITIPSVRFSYGQEAVEVALQSSHRIATRTVTGKPTVKRIGTALSYRFVRDARGWRVFVSVAAPAVPVTTRRAAGAIGIDINADHLALAETDRFGNLTATRRLDLVTYGKTSEQAQALVGDVVTQIAAHARAAAKPVVVERLDFSRKKAALEDVNRRRARMLSSLVYNKILSGLRAACFRAGVEVITVNPAYTSVIGAVNHARQKGISVHQGAAYVLARRGLRLSERPTVREAIVPTRNGGHVAFALPVRNRVKHVWSFWSRVRSDLKVAHAAHVRRGAHKTAPPPLRPRDGAGLGAVWTSPARSRSANRQQHCSADVLPDAPF